MTACCGPTDGFEIGPGGDPAPNAGERPDLAGGGAEKGGSRVSFTPRRRPDPP